MPRVYVRSRILYASVARVYFQEIFRGRYRDLKNISRRNVILNWIRNERRRMQQKK